MARPLPIKNKTVKVRSTVTVLGLNPGQIAEIDDTQQVRDLIAGGLLVLIVSKGEIAATKPVVTETIEDLPDEL